MNFIDRYSKLKCAYIYKERIQQSPLLNAIQLAGLILENALLGIGTCTSFFGPVHQFLKSFPAFLDILRLLRQLLLALLDFLHFVAQTLQLLVDILHLFSNCLRLLRVCLQHLLQFSDRLLLLLRCNFVFFR